MPNTARLRAAALTAASMVVSAALLAGCSDDSGDGSGNGAGDGEDLTSQELDWKDCPAPSEAEGGGTAPPRCRTATSGSAPP